MMTDTIPIKIKYKYYTGTLDITMGKVKYGITYSTINDAIKLEKNLKRDYKEQTGGKMHSLRTFRIN